jgi:bifunctional DNA-binding transcriptional regulator/antitoxin component of YhaV-PrlF toxin-antitoxin module
MAWLLAIPAVAVAGYVGYEANKLYEYVTDPIYAYFKKEDEDKEQRILEEIRQESVERTKKMYDKHDEIRKQYNLKSKDVVKLINDSNNKCTIIYVNKYSAKDGKEAITWAKQVMDINYLESGLSNKMNTKKVTLKMDTDIMIIAKEIDEYFLVLHLNDKFVLLDKIDFENKNIYVKSKFAIKDDSVEIDGCKSWGNFF